MQKKLAFIYDHRYYYKEDKIYSNGAFNYNVWKRFLDGFEHVTVFGTLYQAGGVDLEKMNRVDGPRVFFEHVPYLSSVTDYAKSLVTYNSILYEKLKDMDAAVVRLPGRLSANAYWTAKRAGLTVGVEVVGCPWDAYWNYGNIKGKILAPIAYWRMKRILQNATHAVYVTKDFLQERYPTNGESTNASNVHINIPNDNILKKRIAKLEKEQRDQPFTIGIMGSMRVRYKGHTELLKAISSIKYDIKIPWKIEVVGSGCGDWIMDLAEELNIKKNIKIIGKLPSGRPVMEWLDSIDLYVHPSKQEGLPRSVIEAMSRGCPVLASSVAGIPELLENEYMHKPGNFKKLAYQLKRILGDEDKLINMAKTNFETSLKYDSSILQNRREKFWQQFAN